MPETFDPKSQELPKYKPVALAYRFPNTIANKDAVSYSPLLGNEILDLRDFAQNLSKIFKSRIEDREQGDGNRDDYSRLLREVKSLSEAEQMTVLRIVFDEVFSCEGEVNGNLLSILNFFTKRYLASCIKELCQTKRDDLSKFADKLVSGSSPERVNFLGEIATNPDMNVVRLITSEFYDWKIVAEKRESEKNKE